MASSQKTKHNKKRKTAFSEIDSEQLTQSEEKQKTIEKQPAKAKSKKKVKHDLDDVSNNLPNDSTNNNTNNKDNNDINIHLSDTERKKIVAHITKTAIKAIQKAGHSRNKKPYTEINEGMSYEIADSLLANYGELLTKNKDMIRKQFTPEQIFRFLPDLPKIIHPVAYDGFLWVLPGEKPKPPYIWAAFESLVVKYTNSTHILNLKFRTYQVKSGIAGTYGICVRDNEFELDNDCTYLTDQELCTIFEIPYRLALKRIIRGENRIS